MRRGLLLAAIAGTLAVGALGLARRQELWRAAYPHLPSHVQAAPYVLRARLRSGEERPGALPTAVRPRSSAATPAIGTAAMAATSGGGAAPPPATPRPVATPTSAPRAAELPPAVEIAGVRHEYQTWNNCGPATISMALSPYGASEGQAAAARLLKPDPDDKNVSPSELADYARARSIGATVRVNGSIDRLRTLLALGVPVVVETWFVPEPGDEMGHYRVLVGYDDARRALIAMDSYNGPSVSLPYDSFDALWRVFNRVYVPVYVPGAEPAVRAALGADLDDTSMYTTAVARAEAELLESPDAFAWFNLGGSLLALGDAAGAAGAFDRARDVGLPWRMLWYQFGPYEAYAAMGRWQDVLALSEATLRTVGNLEESLYWQGRAREATGDVAGARTAWEAALAVHPGFPSALAALADARSGATTEAP